MAEGEDKIPTNSPPAVEDDSNIIIPNIDVVLEEVQKLQLNIQQSPDFLQEFQAINMNARCGHFETLPDMSEKADQSNLFMIKPHRYEIGSVENYPDPRFQEYRDLWDEDHVKMPCSKFYVGRLGFSKWGKATAVISDLMNKAIDKKATYSDLEKTIRTLMDDSLELKHLENLIQKKMSREERKDFMENVLPGLCNLALDVKKICGEPPPLLKSGSNKSVTMSQMQAASLLACSFFCLFPFRTRRKEAPQYRTYPSPNFERLYGGTEGEKIAKLECLLHYFKRVTTNMPKGVITIRRSYLSFQQFPLWNESKKPLVTLKVATNVPIEIIPNALHADFANKYIGGGVVSSGCVQEEIRFIICPEMIVSLILCERMEENECIYLIGCEQYCTYQGYGQRFKFADDFEDKTPKDSWARRKGYLVAMDAIHFEKPEDQYKINAIAREIHKAYVSFLQNDWNEEIKNLPIATGHWGCGVFNGDKQLKAIIQLLAASEAGRTMIYTCFGDNSFKNRFNEVYTHLRNAAVTVGDLWNLLRRFSQQEDHTSLFQLILSTSEDLFQHLH